MTPTPSRWEGLQPMRIPQYRNFIVARFCYIMAMRMVGTVVAYRLFQLTKSSLSIGIMGLAEFVPVFLLALYAGYRIDRSDKRKILVQGLITYSLCVAALLAVTAPGVQAVLTGQTQTVLGRSLRWLELLFYLIIFFTGVIRAFVGPTSSAMIAQLVPKDMLQYAATLSSTSWLSASIIGHAGAGFLIAGVGVHYTFYVVLGLMILSTLLMSRLPSLAVSLVPKAGVSMWASMREGLSYVYQNKILLGAISLDLFAVLFGGAVALIPEVTSEILKVGPKAFGFLNAAIDIGSGLMLLFTNFFPLRQKQGQILMLAVAGFGLCIIVFGLSDVYWMAFAALLLAGMLDGISVVVRSTVLQLTTPDTMRGRVSAVNSMFVNSSNELGQFESGATSALFGGARPAILFGGLMTMLVVVIAWIKAPMLRKFEW